jgi:4-hydroxy-tetrahydrodipicolinate reductase
MGKEILAVAERDSSFKIINIDLRKKGTEPDPSLIDVAIEFSIPLGALNVSQWCVRNKKPLVSGTTGFSPDEDSEFRKTSKEIPLFWSPNMSIGLNAMAEAMTHFAHNFLANKVTIDDVHHINKKDKPSGTAKFLHSLVLGSVAKTTQVFDPVSVREGDVFGIHNVNFFGNGETVSFRHEAQNRSIFAQGALQASQWISKKGPGFYQMKDLLK